MATTLIWSIKNNLKQSINYIINPEKTIFEEYSKTNYEEYRNLMGKRENLWKRYHRAKSEKDKSEILTEINDIHPQK